MKRFFDISVSLFLIILLLPLFILILFISFFTQGFPLFFIQERPGFNSKIFKIVKFRTMTVDSKFTNESKRVTVFGKILRDFSIDELPELYNVLIGEMSFVGPRPLLKEYLKFYNKKQLLRHSVKPGITGWAQINGRNAISWQKKFELDIWYVQNQSFVLDLKIIFITVNKLFKRENINNQSGKIPSKFNGSN